jgi:hypothetical protein
MSVEFSYFNNIAGTSRLASFPGNAFTNIGNGSIGEGETHTYQMGATWGQGVANSNFDTIIIGAQVYLAAPYNLNWYGYFSPTVTVTITGTKSVGGSTTSGAGADGKVSFSYVSTQAIVFALSPFASSDASGNAYAAGYTGPVNVFQPGVSPSVVETWHDLGTPTGAGTFTKTLARYKLMPGNAVRVEVIGSFSTSGTASFPAIPSAYWPGATLNFPIIAANVANRAQLSSAGVVAIVVPSATSINFCQDIPLD